MRNRRPVIFQPSKNIKIYRSTAAELDIPISQPETQFLKHRVTNWIPMNWIGHPPNNNIANIYFAALDSWFLQSWLLTPK